LPIPARLTSEPALVSPYLTDGTRLLRIVSRVSLGNEMVLLLEDCRTLEVVLRTWREIAGRPQAIRTPADHPAGR
jgi:hypothetical protein